MQTTLSTATQTTSIASARAERERRWAETQRHYPAQAIVPLRLACPSAADFMSPAATAIDALYTRVTRAFWRCARQSDQAWRECRDAQDIIDSYALQDDLLLNVPQHVWDRSHRAHNRFMALGARHRRLSERATQLYLALALLGRGDLTLALDEDNPERRPL